MAGLGKTQRLRQTALAALVTQPSVALASAQCGVSPRSLARWIKEPQFAAELAAARNEVLDAALERLKTAAFNAVGTLIEVAASPAASDMARVSSSKALIELALRVGSIQQLTERVEQLERDANVSNWSTEESAQTFGETSAAKWE